MPVSYAIDRHLDIITMTLVGSVIIQDFLQYFDATQADPAYHPGMSRLVALDHVDSFPKSSDLTGIAARIRSRTHESAARIAVVADTPLQIGIANMLSGQAGLLGRFKTFSDRTSAMAWLVTASNGLTSSGPIASADSDSDG